MPTPVIDRILRDLRAEKSQLDVKYATKVDAIIKDLEALKDNLDASNETAMQQRELVPRLQERLAPSPIDPDLGTPIDVERAYRNFTPRAFNNPYEFLIPEDERPEEDRKRDAAARAEAEARFKKAQAAGAIDKKAVFEWHSTLADPREARDHRRRMHEHIIEGIEAYNKDLKQHLKDSRETPKDRATRLHKEKKIDGEVLYWNLRKRKSAAEPITEDEKVWRKSLLYRKNAPQPKKTPDAERQKIIKKATPDNTAFGKVVNELEILRKNLLVIYAVLAEQLNHAKQANVPRALWSYDDLAGHVDRIYSIVMKTAIEDKGLYTNMLHYQVVDVSETFPRLYSIEDYQYKDNLKLYEITGPNDPATLRRPRITLRRAEDQGTKLFRVFGNENYNDGKNTKDFSSSHFLNHPNKGVESCKRQLRKLVKFIKGGKYQDVYVTDEDLLALIDLIGPAIAEARTIIYDLQQTTLDRKNPNRFSNELKTLPDASKKVAAQIALWEDAIQFLVTQYNLLQEMPTWKDDTAYKTGLIDLVGAILRSNLFSTPEKRELYEELCSITDSEVTDARGRVSFKPRPEDRLVNRMATDHIQKPHELWPNWFECQGQWICWEEDFPSPADHPEELEYLMAWIAWSNRQVTAFEQRIAALSREAFDDLYEMAIMMNEMEQIELAYLVEFAREDLAVRDEVDWIRYAREIEALIRSANGAIIYVESLDKAYKAIRYLAGKVLGNLNADGYPRVGSALLSFSVGLTAGAEFGEGGKASVSLVATFSGILSQDDDRRVRFKGAFSLGLKGELSGGVEATKETHHGVMNPEEIKSTKHELTKYAYASAKAKLGVSKGLFSAHRTWVYADHEHMAASWAHNLALAYTHVRRPIRWIQHIGHPEHGIDVINPRNADEDDQEILKLIADDEYEDLRKYVQRDVINNHSVWQGLTHWGDLQVSADASGGVGPLTAKFHAESLVHVDKVATFWKDVYLDSQDMPGHAQKNWTLKPKPGDSQPTTKKGASKRAQKKSKSKRAERAKVLTASWSKSYPPMGTADLSLVRQLSTPGPGYNETFVEMFGGGSKEPVITDLFGFESSGDVGMNVDLGFSYIENHPNPDNDGMYLNLKCGRSAGMKFDFQVVSFAANKTLGRAINRREIRLFFNRLNRLAHTITRDRTLKAESKQAAAKLVENSMGIDKFVDRANPLKGVFWTLMRNYYWDLRALASFGTFEITLVYSDQDDGRAGWAIQYGRIWRSVSFAVESKIEVAPGVSVDLGGTLERNVAPVETLGNDTLTYLQTVYDGLYLRDKEKGPKNDYWTKYKEVHLPEILDLCYRIGLTGEMETLGPPSNAYLEVLADKKPNPPDDRLKQAAEALIKACKETGPTGDIFLDDRQAGASVKNFLAQGGTYAKDAAKQLVKTAKQKANRLRRQPTVRASAVLLFNDLTGATSLSWPRPDGTLPGEDESITHEYFFANPTELHYIVYLLENPDDIVHIRLDIFSRTSPTTPVWTSGDFDPRAQEAATEDEEESTTASEEETEAPDSHDFLIDPNATESESEEEEEVIPEEDVRRTEYAVRPANLEDLKSPHHHGVYKWKTMDESPFRDGTLAAGDGPFKLQLTVIGDAQTTRSDQPTAWTYFYLLEPSILNTLEAYLEAKFLYAPTAQASEWRDSDGTEIPKLIIDSQKLPAVQSGDGQAGKLPTIPQDPSTHSGADPSTEEQEEDDAAPVGTIQPGAAIRRGIPNVGNTCYINSVIKLLAMAPEYDSLLRDTLTQDPYILGTRVAYLTASDQALDKETLENLGRREVANLGSIGNRKTLQQHLGALITSLREDHGEAVTVLEEALPRALVGATQPFSWKHTGDEEDAALFLQHLFDTLEMEWNLFVRLHSRLQPPNGHPRIRREYNALLTLEIPAGNTITMQDCLNASFAPETIRGVAGFGDQPVEKRLLSLEKEAPHTLICVLKRFRHTGTDDPAKKLSPVTILPDLNYPVYAGLLNDKMNSVAMEPWGIVRHHGQTLKSGHYTMLQRTSDGTWLHHNDSHVSAVDPAVIQDKGTITNYIVLYRRKEQEPVIDELEPAIDEFNEYL